MDSKANTPSPIRFLIQMYLVTGDASYRQAAVRQDRLHPIGDHSRPERIRFPAADRRMVAHGRRTAFGHGILHPEIQNPPALLPGFQILIQISVAQQLIPDPRLLSDETELEGR